MATQTSDDAPTSADAAIPAVDPFTAAAAMPAPAPTGQPRPRRKVRHVQIQTRSATLKDQTTQCDAAFSDPEAPPPAAVTAPSVAASTGAAAGGDELARLRAELAESNAQRQSAESALASLRASSAAAVSRAECEAREAREALDRERRRGPDPELARLREEVAGLTLERDALGARVGELVMQATEREGVMEGEKDKFERLSSQAFRKIKELLTERRVVEVEVEGLRSQLEALEEHQKKWVADTDDEDEGDAKDDAK
ncbi:hypothetical protein HK101_008415 [Irineochytrium annulatum]|nr:hypothetical protein HK101_008415 [Irineochytrium annulatum]